MFNNSSELKNW